MGIIFSHKMVSVCNLDMCNLVSKVIQIWIKDPNIELDRKYRGFFLVFATEKVFVFPDNMLVKFINNSLKYDYC